MAIEKLNDLLDQNDSTQANSYLYEANTGIAIDYSPYLSRIAAALETIANSLNNGSTPVGTILSEIAQASENTAIATEATARSLAGIYDRSKGVGINTKGPQDWIGLISSYKIYVENAGPEKMSLDEFKSYYDKIAALPKDF
jgi:hypothetical protein